MHEFVLQAGGRFYSIFQSDVMSLPCVSSVPKTQFGSLTSVPVDKEFLLFFKQIFSLVLSVGFSHSGTHLFYSTITASVGELIKMNSFFFFFLHFYY